MSAASAPAAVPLLAAQGVTVSLGGTQVLRGVDLEVRGREVVGLLGPNGAGKSTFLRAATGLVPLTGGSIAVEGVSVDRIARRNLARAVAVVQQLPEAPGSMLVEELVLLGRNPHLGLLSRESARDYAAAADAMRRTGCEEFAHRPLRTLSGGQRRRAFIARALAQEPRLLLLDEPNANLDVQAQAEAFELLRALARDGVGVLVAVHDLTLAAAYCDRVAMLVDGRVIASGAPAAVVTSEVVSRVYGDRVMVIPHPQSGAPIVVPAVMERADA
ncbi:MAG: ABC transporter ATP-binding protein [Dehalococcoidia bacterium]